MSSSWPSKRKLFFSFACLVVLVICIQFSSLPGLHKKTLDERDYNSSIYSTSSIPSSDGSKADVNGTSPTHSGNESKADMNLPIMDFEDMGDDKKKFQLLIIVSTAPQRPARRQAIRESWWKHCNESQVREPYCGVVEVC